MGRLNRLLRHRLVQAVLALTCVAVVVGLAAFEPWKLWVDKTVVEALPRVPIAAPVTEVVAAADPVAAQPVAAEPVAAEPVAAEPAEAVATPPPTPQEAKNAEPVELFRGTFITHEHGTTGIARVLRLADGSRVLRLEDLDTSNGPDLKVVLSDAPVLAGRPGWHVFDDDAHVKLANLKGNRGSQNYAIPAGVDLAALRSVSIWCDRFNVSFGAAALTPST